MTNAIPYTVRTYLGPSANGPKGEIIKFEDWRGDLAQNREVITVFEFSPMSSTVRPTVGYATFITDGPHAQFGRSVRIRLLRNGRLGKPETIECGREWPAWVVVVEGDHSKATFPSLPEDFDDWFLSWTKRAGVKVLADWRAEARRDGSETEWHWEQAHKLAQNLRQPEDATHKEPPKASAAPKSKAQRTENPMSLDDDHMAGRFDEAFRPYGDPQRSAASTAPPARLKPIDVFLSEYEPLEYALEPIIRTGSLYTLTARTGAGKTAWLISVTLAIAAGRNDILNMEVERGRVALLTFENPDDVRMRLKVSSWFLRVDIADLIDRLLILDVKVKPEEALLQLEAAAKDGPLRLVLVDTLAAFFDGDNINDNVQGGGFMRRLRPITRLPGRPAVVVAAHPVKNAPQDNLLPYGGGAILNEVDGNLTLWRRSEGADGIVELHWQGKLRGLEFNPIQFRFEITSSPEVKDAKGREVGLPTMLPSKTNANDIEAKAKAEISISVALLKAMLAKPQATQREWADTIGRSVSTLNGKLNKLKADKLVEVVMDHPRVTAKGEKEAERWP